MFFRKILYFNLLLIIGWLILPRYQYIGLFIDLSYMYYAVHITCLTLLVLFTKKIGDKPSYYAINGLINFYYIPLGVFYTLVGADLGFYVFVNAQFALLVMLVLGSFRVTHLVNLFSPQIAFVVFIVFALLALVAIITKNGVPSFNALDLAQIYDVRSKFESSRLIQALQTITTFFIVPYFVFSGRGPLLHCFAFTIMIVVFLSSGGKFIFAVYLFFLAMRLLRRIVGREKVLDMLVISLVLAALALEITSFNVYNHFLIFRPLLVPAWFSVEYYNFFNNSPFLYYSEAFNFIFKTVDQPIAAIRVGDAIYPDRGGTYANVGVFGYAYANLGYLSFLDIIVTAMTFRTLDYAYKLSQGTELSDFVLVYATYMGVYLGTTNIFVLLKSRMGVLILITLVILAGSYKKRSQTNA